MHLTARELSELTGVLPATIRRKLAAADVEVVKRGRIFAFPSKEALRVLYVGEGGGHEEVDLEEARTAESEAKAQKIDLQCQVIRGERIQIDRIGDTFDGVSGELKGLIKRAASARRIKRAEKSRLFTAFRETGRRLRW